MHGGPSGFHNAPVTKTFVIASAILTVALGLRHRSLGIGLSYEDIFQKFKFWKLIAAAFAFSSTPELLFGLYLLYYFRVFERQIGSNKHTVFIVFSVAVSLLFEVLALAYLKDPTLNTLTSGPYGLIFASFVPFYFDIPISSRIRIFGIQFTDKSFIYLAGLQLLFSSWKRSLIPGMCGVLAGVLYRLNLFGIRKIKFPDAAASIFSRLSLPSTVTSSQTSSSEETTRLIPSYTGVQVEVNNPSGGDRIISAPLPPSQASVATLVSMGFDSNYVRQALIHSGNDINVATNILIEAQSR